MPEAERIFIPGRVIIHHTADSYTGDQLDKVNAWHKERFEMKSKRGFWVGYHYLIEKSGEVIQTRELDEEGAHTKGWNLSAIGVCLAGNFDLEYPAEKQMDSLKALFDSLFGRDKLRLTDISFHREFKNTNCPGLHFTDEYLIRELLRRASNIVTKLLLWAQLIALKR